MHINMFTAPNNWPPLQQAVVRFWDIGIHWNQMETNTNTFVWTKFDASTNVVWTNNPATQIIYTLGQTPAWAALTTNTPTAKNGPGASSEPRDMNDWSNYVQTVALRYKGLSGFTRSGTRPFPIVLHRCDFQHGDHGTNRAHRPDEH